MNNKNEDYSIIWKRDDIKKQDEPRTEYLVYIQLFMAIVVVSFFISSYLRC